ncbi:hypothetical protein MMB232_00191 [Brevundimonas subvibrioides]|uniref:NADPH-dependent FMN reductase n=1 Tax=Brevundimonas subvibrioides TaxID=74313 RepID=UPI0032D56DD9
MALKLNVIFCSTRPSRAGTPVAEWVDRFAREQGAFDVEMVDLAAFDLPLFDEAAHPAQNRYEHAHTKRWSASVAPADAFVFVAPEYDYFAPAAVINAIQCLYHEWTYKPAAVVSYGGVSGGLRSSQTLRGLLGNLNMMAIAQAVPVPFFTTFIGDDGVFNPNEQTVAGTTTMLTELHKWAVALKPMREPQASA